MSRKLEGNGLWESSRMILPEHKERIRQWRNKEKMREKTMPDEQAWEEWSGLIQESYAQGRLITITIYDPYQEIKVTGQIQRIDSQQQRFLFIHDRMKTWVPFEDIIWID